MGLGQCWPRAKEVKKEAPVLSLKQRQNLEQKRLIFDARKIKTEERCRQAEADLVETKQKIAGYIQAGQDVPVSLIEQMRQRSKFLGQLQRNQLADENDLNTVQTLLSTADHMKTTAELNDILIELAKDLNLKEAAKVIRFNVKESNKIAEFNDSLTKVTATSLGNLTVEEALGDQVEFTEEEQRDLRRFVETSTPTPSPIKRETFALSAADRDLLLADRAIMTKNPLTTI